MKKPTRFDRSTQFYAALVAALLLITFVVCESGWTGSWDFDQGISETALKGIQEHLPNFVPTEKDKECDVDGLAKDVKTQVKLSGLKTTTSDNDKAEYRKLVDTITLDSAQKACLTKAVTNLSREKGTDKLSTEEILIVSSSFNLGRGIEGKI